MVSLLSLFSIFGIFGIIDCWRDSWRAYLENNAKNLKKSTQDPPKSSPGASKIDPGGLQETPFFKTFILGVLLEGRLSLSGTILSQNKFQNEAQEASRSRPKPSKIDVEKHDVFGTDFSRVRTSLWEGFWVVF